MGATGWAVCQGGIWDAIPVTYRHDGDRAPRALPEVVGRSQLKSQALIVCREPTAKVKCARCCTALFASEFGHE